MVLCLFVLDLQQTGNLSRVYLTSCPLADVRCQQSQNKFLSYIFDLLIVKSMDIKNETSKFLSSGWKSVVKHLFPKMEINLKM